MFKDKKYCLLIKTNSKFKVLWCISCRIVILNFKNCENVREVLTLTITIEYFTRKQYWGCSVEFVPSPFPSFSHQTTTKGGAKGGVCPCDEVLPAQVLEKISSIQSKHSQVTCQFNSCYIEVRKRDIKRHTKRKTSR